MNQAEGGAADPVRRQWGAVAAAYASSPTHSSGPDLAALVEAAALTGGERVLDLGCGAGHTALALAPRAAAVVAVDVTPEMLAVATELAAQRGVTNVTFRQADVAALPLSDAGFDVVVTRFSAHHWAAPEQALAEARRALRPGGRFLMVDTLAPEEPALDTFYNAAELLRDSSHARNWRVSEWLRMLAAAGFRPALLMETHIDNQGEAWVTRSQTPPDRVAAIKALFAAASPAARERFAIHLDNAWGWRLPIGMLRGE